MNISPHTNKAGINNQPFTPKLLWYQIFIQISWNQFFLWSNKHPSHSDSSVSATFLPTSVTTSVLALSVLNHCSQTLKARFKGNYSGASGSPERNSIPYIFREFLENQQIGLTGSLNIPGDSNAWISENFLQVLGSLESLVILVISWDAF